MRPQAWQVEEHNAKGHVHFEAWCEHCVRGRAQENQHRRSEGYEVREIPNVAIDYCWMGKKDEEIGMPILGGIDEESGSLLGDVVPAKGLHPHAVKRLQERVDFRLHADVVSVPICGWYKSCYIRLL